MNPLITKLTLAFIGAILCLTASAQSPALINYQAVARNAATGAELSNQSLYLILKVRSGSPAGNIVYQEEHLNAATNEFGLFNIQIGAGSALNGNFSSLNWGMGPYWLEIDMDAGSGLETLGSMQFVSVPYALHAGSADNVDDDDADPTNELITDFSLQDNQSLSIIEGANVHTVDLSGLVNVDDIDPTNELQTLAEVIAFSVPPGSAGAQRITDLSNPVDAQDAATKSYVDNFSLTGDLDQTLDNPRVVALQSRPISIVAPTNGQVLVYNQASNSWQPQTLPSGPQFGEQYYSIDISAFAETKKSGDADKTNMVIYQENPSYLTIYDGGLGNRFIAPIQLLDGVKMTEIKYSFRKMQPGHYLRFRLIRQTPAEGTSSTIAMWHINAIETSSATQTLTQDITSADEGLRTVDNSQYTYRLEIQFNIEGSTYDGIGDVMLMFYGANLKYSY